MRRGFGKPEGGRRFWIATLLLALVAALVLAACGGSDGTTTSSSTAPAESEPAETEEGGIAAAPAFTSDELFEHAGDNWISNGGGTTNDRFSTLDEINTENVKELKGEWMTKIGQNATAAKFSAEGQAIEYEGTIYISDGADDVFALDAGNGHRLWTYEPHLPPDPLGEVVCCGWDNRGVAIGDGMVFVSQLNGAEVALDQATGKVKWSTNVVKPGEGFSITSAPLYYNNKVYVGGSGGEYGVRGRLTALNAETGKEEWRFWTTPSPSEFGGDTWPKDGRTYKTGGASIWNTPTVNPKTGLLFFSTSNAAPWTGENREGENLFTASIVGLDAETGKYHCHFQEVHHDLWDYDAPSPTVLFEGEMNGEQVEAVGEPEKTGWVYLVSQKDCKPIYPIPEVKVPQDPQQNTWPTQPEPTMEPFSPVEAQPEAIKKAEEGAASLDPKPKVVGSKAFTPNSSDPNVVNLVANAAVGGDNWPPSSYDPEKNMYFVCSQSGALGLIVPPKEAQFKQGQTYIGSDTIVASGFETPGYVTAYDMSTGKIKWQNKQPQSCYSGTVTTAGGLLFVGQNDGNLVAYDSETGKELWHWQTGAGANTTVTAFEDEGQEKIAIYAGGNSLAATPHGENFWVFSLTGTMTEPKGLEEAGEGTGHAGEEEEGESGEEAGTGEEEGKEAEGGEEAAAGGAPNAEAGKEVFAEECSVCHGATGHGGNGGPDLTTMPLAKTQAGAEKQVTNGGGGMPAFKGTLSEEEIKNVAAYVVEDIVGGK
ncbi:MAG TPA: PQQ-binding-like beta-propeller repeat protein [Solirubrobacterales bacterium]|nr:PQQ-binding-like beta-propeller repeat protein [Solirubrobacterales bacterium]